MFAAFAVLALQAAPLTPPALPPQLELTGGVVVTAEDYLRHLYSELGSARLRELLLDRALAKEAEALDFATLPTATAQALRDPDRTARAAVAERVRQDFGGDRAAYARDLANRGLRADEALWLARQQGLREARVAALVAARREPTDAALRRVFEEHYGVDGLRVAVRQIFQSFGTERHKLQAAGQPLDPAALEETVRKRVAALYALHQGGTPFHLLVARGSEDPQGRAFALAPATAERAGEIEGYNFQHYGPEFADAVRAMQPGEVRGPLRTSHGYHIIWLVRATRTEFAAVEKDVRARLREAPPSLAERRALLEQLSARYRIEEALR
jgi:hypothetical protein